MNIRLPGIRLAALAVAGLLLAGAGAPADVEATYRALVDARRAFVAAKAETRAAVAKLKGLRQRLRELKGRRSDFGPAGGELGQLLAEMREEAARVEASRAHTRERKRIQREAFVALQRQVGRIDDPVERRRVANDLRDRFRRDGAGEGGERDRSTLATERGRGFLERVDRTNVQPDYLETLIARIDELITELARTTEPATGPDAIGDDEAGPAGEAAGVDPVALRARLLEERERAVRALGKDPR